MHPACFVPILLLKDGVRDVKLLLCAELQQQTSIVVVNYNGVFKEYASSLHILVHYCMLVTIKNLCSTRLSRGHRKGQSRIPLLALPGDSGRKP